MATGEHTGCQLIQHSARSRRLASDKPLNLSDCSVSVITVSTCVCQTGRAWHAHDAGGKDGTIAPGRLPSSDIYRAITTKFVAMAPLVTDR